jgi:transaldolase
MTSKLEQLKQMTDIVADTGDIEAIKRLRPLDATTNPSLLLKAAALPDYAPMLKSARAYAAAQDTTQAQQLGWCTDHLAVAVGTEILRLIEGRVSTEVDARLSFDTVGTIARARRLIGLYEERGIGRERVLIKMAATWEGIRAAEMLEREGIHCNLTLLFGFGQAAACAEAGVTLISPFVGRILDWHLAQGAQVNRPEEDPGVRSVARIYNFYKQHRYETIVMGASFRNTGQIEMLAGCDRLTISPALLDELAADPGELSRRLDPRLACSEEPRSQWTESRFRLTLNEDEMACSKLAEGIRLFCVDQERLERLIMAD